MKRNLIRLVLLAIMTSASVAVSAQSFAKKTLIKFGDREVTAGEFMEVYEKNNLKGEVAEVKSIDEYIDIFTDFKLKVFEAEALGLDTVSKFLKEVEEYRNQLAKPYLTSDGVSEDLVKEAFERMQYDINAAHILVKCGTFDAPADTLRAYKKALELRNRIVKGGEDFNAVAFECSEDPSARDMEAIPGRRPFMPGNKGELGYFTVFDMVYPFETAAYNTPVGEVSMPVRTDFGYHIVKVNSKTPACGVINVAHIFLQVNDKDIEHSDSIVKIKADNIRKEITAENWPIMVSRYSDDKGTIANEGRLSPIRVGSIVPQFIDVVKNIEKGQISEPVKTIYGYHIIKLIGTMPPTDFETLKPKIEERVKRDMRSVASEQAVVSRIMKEEGFKENVKAKDGFMATIDSSIIEGKYSLPEGVDGNKVLFSIGKKKYIVSDFAAYIEKNQRAYPFKTPTSYAYELYNDFVNVSVKEYEKSILEDKYSDFRIVMREYHDGILLFDFMEKEVWKKASNDTLALQAYYDEHKSEYMWGDRVKAMIGTVTREESLPRMHELISSGLSVDSIKSIIKTDSIRFVSIKEHFYQKGDNIYVDQTPWTVGAIQECPSDKDKAIRVVRITDVRKPEPKSFKEAKGLVTSDYQTILEKELLKELREKYPVTIDEKVFAKVKKYFNK